MELLNSDIFYNAHFPYCQRQIPYHTKITPSDKTALFVHKTLLYQINSSILYLQDIMELLNSDIFYNAQIDLQVYGSVSGN